MNEKEREFIDCPCCHYQEEGGLFIEPNEDGEYLCPACGAYLACPRCDAKVEAGPYGGNCGYPDPELEDARHNWNDSPVEWLAYCARTGRR